MINLDSKVNGIQPTYAIKLGFHARKVNSGIQKIDKSYLDIFRIVIADYSVKNMLQMV